MAAAPSAVATRGPAIGASRRVVCLEADRHQRRCGQRQHEPGGHVSDGQGRPDGGDGRPDLLRREPRPRIGRESRGDRGRQRDGGHAPQHEGAGWDEPQPGLAGHAGTNGSILRAEDQLHAELEQEGEADRLHQQLEDEEALDDRQRQESGLDGHEQVAPFHQPVDDAEAGEPGERASERKLRALPALEGDGQPHDEEHLPVDRQDDDPVRLEQLGQPAHAGDGTGAGGLVRRRESQPRGRCCPMPSPTRITDLGELVTRTPGHDPRASERDCRAAAVPRPCYAHQTG